MNEIEWRLENWIELRELIIRAMGDGSVAVLKEGGGERENWAYLR